MTFSRLANTKEAVEDCTRAIGLDPTYVKAYQRRAAAHRQLGASLEAARDWEQALRLEPENRATAADRDASVEQLLSERKLQPPSRRTAVPVSWVLPPPPPPPPPPSQQEPPQQQQQQGQEQHAPAVRGIGPASPMQRPPPSKTALPASITGGSVGMGTEAVEGRAVAAVSDSSSSVQLPAAVAPSCQPLLPPSQQQEAVATAGASPVTPGGAATGTRGVASATAATAAATAAVGGSGGASGAMKNVPRTSVEFEAAWRSMAGDLRRQAAYLAAIPPASLPSIFKNSLTAPVLASLVRCLLAGMMPLEAVPATDVSPTSISMSMTSESQSASGAVSPAQGVALLEGLTRVARFDLMVMSVPSKERQELRAGWEGVLLGLRSREGNGEGGVGASSPAPDADGPPVIESLEALRRKYRI
ncbi:hypothetical protein Vretimale_16948 [Volvox reticuliferus]|uniref:RNA-polymerase II-associated protein 3-like C-terminal domain-containing protein n=1 Tax=Volvox reticuliferus TaxID=1737510 RepID=A0A8J4GUN7_9CHLO|nr:hypothetical protein Vretimale_16948 [Volvox reticuliferus]